MLLDAWRKNPDEGPMAGASSAEWDAQCIREFAGYLERGVECPPYRAADSDEWAHEDPEAWALIEAEESMETVLRWRTLIAERMTRGK